MRYSSIFWGIALVLIGGLFLLNSLDIIHFNLWNILWPLFLIALGLFIVLGRTYGPRSLDAESASMLLESASRATVRVRYGAGRLQLGSGASLGSLFSGTFVGGVARRSSWNGDAIDVELSIPSPLPVIPFPFMWGRGLDWTLNLTDQIPLVLNIATGASDNQIDLAALRVTDFKLSTGASATAVTFPSNAGMVRGKIESGAASVSVRIPQGVAGRIRFDGALSGITVDRARFPRQEGVYESPDFATAVNKVDLKIEVGVGSVDVR
jgi:hypothetical protein